MRSFTALTAFSALAGLVAAAPAQYPVAATSIIITAPVSSGPAVDIVSNVRNCTDDSLEKRGSDPVVLCGCTADEPATATSASTTRLPLFTTSYTTLTQTTTRTTGTTTRTVTVSAKTGTSTRTTTKTTTVSRSTTLTKTSTSTVTPRPTSTSSTSTSQKTSFTSSSAQPAPSKSSDAPINAVYYPDWSAYLNPPETVDYSLFDILYFSFAMPAADHSLYFIMDESADILRRLVKYGHAAGSKVCITVGGWTGSQYFSNAVSNDWNRKTFAQNIVDMVNAYGADGIDIDWEYPGQNGADGNGVNANDSDNFLIFVKLLRSMLGKDKVISMATPLNVWYGSNGQPMTDVSAFAPYLDHVLLMNYDVWGASSTPGPNAPLNTCGNSDQPGANAVNAVAAWEAAGMPANKIMLGLPAYGYVSDSTATSLIHKRDVKQRRAAILEQDNERKVAALARQHMRMGNTFPVLKETTASKRLARRDEAATATSSEKVFDMPTGIPVKAVNTKGDLSDFMGSQIQFNQLISYKAISLGSTGVWYGKNGYTRRWDDCSQTPFLFNQVKSTVVTYDDPVSIKIKAEFAASKKLKGTGMWDIGGDSSDFVLTKAARAGLGI